MKNLKKIAALVIVLALALSSVSFAAFTDVAEDASYNEAVTVMSALGLLKGYEDGSFGPDKTITRAEFAAVVVRMLGMEDAAAGAATATNFTDVPATHWAAGYVKIANQKEIIAGYGDGKFGPDDEVTYEQAIKMLVCALGYAPMFKDVKDAYPTSYMAQANTLGMTVGATGKIGDKATRAIVARLAYNALDDKLMEQTGFGTDVTYGVPDKYQTPLSAYLKVAKVYVTADQTGFSVEDAEKVTINSWRYPAGYYTSVALGEVYDGEYRDVDADITLPVTAGVQQPKEYKAVEGLEFPKGYSVTAFIDYNDDEPIVKALVPRTGKNETLTITASQMQGATINAATGRLYYWPTSEDVDSRTEEVKIDATGAIKVYANNNLYFGTDASVIASQYNAGTIPSLTLINNDEDSNYDVIIYTAYTSGVVDEIYENSYRVATTGGNFTFDPDDENNTFAIFDAEGKAITFADIKVNDVVNKFVSYESTNPGAPTYTEYIVSSAKVEGTISETASGNKVYIDGKEYIDDTTSLNSGDTGVFYVDIMNHILDKDLDTSSRTFGMLYSIYSATNGADNEIKATIYTKDGEFVEYSFAKNVKVNGVQYASSTFGFDNPTAPTQLTASSANIFSVNPAVVMYAANSSNEINTLVSAANIPAQTDNDYSYVANAAAIYDVDDATIGKNAITDSTVIVANEASTLAKVKDNFSISSKAIFTDKDSYSIASIVDENDEIALLIVNDAKAKADPASPVMIVSAAHSTGSTADGDSYTIVKGYVDGKLVSINVDNDTYIYTAKTHDHDSNAATPEVPVNTSVALNTLTAGSMIQFVEGDIVPAIRVIATAAEVATIANGTFANTWGVDYKDDETGYFKAGKLFKFASNMAYFDPTDIDTDGTYDEGAVKVRFTAGAPTVKLTLNAPVAPATTYTINKVFSNNYSIADADTCANFNAATTAVNDIVVTYSYDGVSLACIVIDVNNNINR